jgi:hypothetical protein
VQLDIKRFAWLSIRYQVRLSDSLHLHDPFGHCRTGSFAVRVDRATRDNGVDVVALSDRPVKAFDKDSSKPFGSLYRNGKIYYY